MKHLFLALLLAAAPAAAQTARIAHLSHSGSLETLDAAADNFGLPSPTFMVDSVRLLSDTTALEYGQLFRIRRNDKWARNETRTIRFSSRKERQQQIQTYQQQRPAIKIISYDTLLKSATPQLQSGAPTLKKQKTKRKKSAFLPAVPAPPQHPGVALAVAAILVLTGAGWLLGEPKPRPQPAA